MTATLPALRGHPFTGIGCDCGALYETAGEIALDEIRAQSWRPIVLECDCGARFVVLGGMVRQVRKGKGNAKEN